MRATFTTPRRAVLVIGLFWIGVALSPGQTIPIAWDEAALASMQTPLRDPARTPKHMAVGVYHQIPLLPFYKTYPVYAPGREPAGYMERLRELEPEVVFHPEQLHTATDWARAGEAILDAPTFFE